MKISAVINTFNSEHYLENVLREIRDFDEVLVVDFGSTDSTLEIAEKMGAKIKHYHLVGTSTLEDARNFSIESAANEWVFFVEPNELVTDALIEYLYSVEKLHPEASGLYIPRKRYILFNYKSRSYPNYRLRMFRRSKTKWPQVKDAHPEVDGVLANIPAHRDDCALIVLSEKYRINREKAGRDIIDHELKKQRDNVSLLSFWMQPFSAFFKTYFVRGAIFEGREGFIIAAENATRVFSELVSVHTLKRLREFNKSNRKNGIEIEESNKDNGF